MWGLVASGVLFRLNGLGLWPNDISEDADIFEDGQLR